MRVMRLGGYNLAISTAIDLLQTKHKPEPIVISKYRRDNENCTLKVNLCYYGASDQASS